MKKSERLLRTVAAAPVDLEIRVTTSWSGGRWFLLYTLTSPSGVAGFFHMSIRSEPINSPETFCTFLLNQIENLQRGMVGHDSPILTEEIGKRMATIGHDLYMRLFPPEMRSAYLRFRDAIKTLSVISDEPWIPWELIKPFGEDYEDDFLCMQFQMSRWLAGDIGPAQEIRVKQIACIDVGQAPEQRLLPHAEKERRIFEDLESEFPGLRCFARPQATLDEMEELLAERDFHLLHFVGHGNFLASRPDMASLHLENGVYHAGLINGPLEMKIRRNRPLVFLNSCRTGQLGQELTGLGGWADRWISRCHCSAFLAPIWRVNDKSGFLFAEAFYQQLKEGETIGEATRAARHHLRAVAPNDPTWLAYNMYGHPNARTFFGEIIDDPPCRRHGERRELGDESSTVMASPLEGMPFTEPRMGFVADILSTLERTPILLLLAQADLEQGELIAAIVRRAKDRYGENTLHITPPHAPEVETSQYFNRIGRQSGFQEKIEGAFDWGEAMDRRLSREEQLFLLVSGFDKGLPTGRKALASTLRGLAERFTLYLRVVLCGSERLAELKYGAEDLSLLNAAEDVTWPDLTATDILAWQQYHFADVTLSEEEARDILDLCGGHPRLVHHLLQSRRYERGMSRDGAYNALRRYRFLQRLFLPYRRDDRSRICEMLASCDLGSDDPWPTDRLVRELYWKNLLTPRRGHLTWRCEALREVGQQTLNCSASSS